MRIPLVCVISALLLLNGTLSLAQEVAATALPAEPANVAAPVEAVAVTAGSVAAVPAKDPVFTQAQLDQMLAPIALYPDPLLAQVLMASTYPGEIAEAVTWSKANPNAKGDDAVKQVATQPWDPSVQALVAFPQVLVLMGQDPVWTQRLGDAFLAQSDDVMVGVQRLRHQAQAAGNLSSNQYQNVTVQAVAAPAPEPAPAASAPSTTVVTTQAAPSTIIIQPADPQVVYVPSYNPTTAYGPWPYPASPPVYYPPPPAYYPGQALMAGLAFGTGVAVVGALWGNCDWGNNDVDIDVNRYNNINGNNRITNNQNKWQHNAAHRDGVPYRDNRSREQFGRQLDGANQRAAFRGDDAKRAQARENARGSMDRAGIERPASSNRQARDQARKAQSAPSAGNRMQAAPERGQGANRNTRDNQQARNQNGQNKPARSQNGQSPRAKSDKSARQNASQTPRQTAKNKPSSSPARARNNAFEGARSPSNASAQANRGRASQASAQRPDTSRAAGRQISRPSSPPSRQRGGGRR